MQIHTLFDLNEHIRRVMALNFQDPLWIAVEIAQVGQSKGHYYLDLVQKGDTQEPVAQAQAVLWLNDYKRLYRRIGPDLEAVLKEGLEVKLQVRVDYHERYGLKLQIVDLDPAFTFGLLSLQRRQTLETLSREGLLDLNSGVPMPSVLQRIAVISSEGAAGFQDFREHLAENPYRYRFDCQLFNAAVQGKNTESEVIAAAGLIAQRAADFDCVVIIRGGGARLDLAAFDGLDLCRHIARLALPVLAGIGHDVDETILDHVVQVSLKTPTAVADFILQHNLNFESDVLSLAEYVRMFTTNQIKIQESELGRLESALHWNTRELLRRNALQINLLEQNILPAAKQIIKNASLKLDLAEQICRAFHPDHVLSRGYSITTKNGKLVGSPSELFSGDELETRLKTGVIKSKVL
ncbi:MAG: exodeoxyribonuclease VII large subunit [Bacteroidota bacterium]